MVLWLAVQMAFMSGCFLALTSILNSFWAVVIRGFRVAAGFGKELIMFHIFSCKMLSVMNPRASGWGMVMLLGVILGGASSFVDTTKDGWPMQQKRKKLETDV